MWSSEFWNLNHLDPGNEHFGACVFFPPFSPFQAFYPANKDVDVKYGDTLAARCMFSGEGRTSNTYIGWVLLLKSELTRITGPTYTYIQIIFLLYHLVNNKKMHNSSLSFPSCFSWSNLFQTKRNAVGMLLSDLSDKRLFLFAVEPLQMKCATSISCTTWIANMPFPTCPAWRQDLKSCSKTFQLRPAFPSLSALVTPWCTWDHRKVNQSKLL